MIIFKNPPQLLDGDNELISALYGLLMLLPQSEAFNLVKGRLACVPHVQKQDKHRDAKKSKKKKFMDEIDFPSLLEHFQVRLSLPHHNKKPIILARACGVPAVVVRA